ncbi:unnamed protein product [Phytophthora fragariaefolia]|uniref:Unnamed protein product n=1 Tax=Phytophthora fragariaefolia TaxID=1490495 RepID=A0A9W6YQ34_9STRA|nr:unnamed protein product [Phytophthora fragariaefolia]
MDDLPVPVLRVGANERDVHGALVHARRDSVFTAPKDTARSWNNHFLYLIILMRATDAWPAMVLQNIIRHASPRFSPALLGRYNETQPDLMLHEQELVQFAQRFHTDAMNRKDAGKDVVNAVSDTRQSSLITNSDVYYAPTLTRNLLSLGQLVKRGCALTKKHGSLVITNGGEPAFRVRFEHDVLVANLTAIRSTPHASVTVAMSASLAPTVADGVQYGSLMHFHERFGHLALNTVERISRDPHSGISITDHTRTKCVACAEGKQSKRRQLKKGSGENAPIERIGGVICSDLKLTPRDRLGDRYLVNFVAHRSNYCRVFANKTKDEAARKFHDFLTFFEKRLSCMIDGGVDCLYFKADSSGTTLVGTYVHDHLVTGTSTNRVNAFLADMQVLALKDLGPAMMLLGVSIEYEDKSGCSFGQKHAIEELLQKNRLAQAHSVRHPTGEEQDVPITADELLPELPARADLTMPTIKMFQSLVGALLWIASSTRSGIAFAVHRTSPRTHAPTLQDWKLAKQIARYLFGTLELRFHMVENQPATSVIDLVYYTNADVGGDRVDRKSVSGAVLCLNGMVEGWTCKKQSSVALSTAEAEFVAASIGGHELLGLRELLAEFGTEVQLPTDLLMDNQAAILQVKNEASSGRVTNIDIRIKFLRD